MTTTQTDTEHRGYVGAKVRLFGLTGIFEITGKSRSGFYHWRVEPVGSIRCDFDSLDTSIVEVDGEPCALIDIPLSAPASDWPHGKTPVELPREHRCVPSVIAALRRDERFAVA